MIVDPIQLAATHKIKAKSFSVILQREDYLIAKLETASGPIVLKASTIPTHVSDWDAKNCLLLKEAGLPVPNVIAYGEDPISFALLTWIEGDPLSAKSPISAQIEAGELLKEIHHLTNRPEYNRDYTFDAWMEGWLHVALTFWSQQTETTTKAIDAVWAGFKQIQPILASRGNHFMM